MYNTPILDDKELFDRIAQGDEEAFTKIFYQYTSIIYPFVFKKVKSQAATEEIVQDVFLKLWTKRELLIGINAPSSYLMRIATNRTLDYLKHKAIEHKYLQNTQAQSGQELVADEVSFREAKKILDEAIAAMPPQRRTIYLLQQDGFSYEEIAERLQISPHTVRNHIVLAYKYLKAQMKEQGLSLFIILFIAGK